MKLVDLAGSREYFLGEVWRRNFHLARAAVTDPADVLSLADVDSLITQHGLRRPSLTVVRDGVELSPNSYTYRDTEGTGGIDGLYDPAGIAAELRRGSSITIRGLEHSWPSVKRTCRDLELELGHPIQANGYLSPAGSLGYPLHHDIHDVFVLQTAGGKEWEVNQPTGQSRFALAAGDCLYQPQGLPHRAWATDCTSLHVSFGVRQVVDTPWHRRRPPLDGHLRDCLALDGISPADEVRWRLDHLSTVENGNDIVVLTLWNGPITLSASHRAALEQLKTGEPTSIGAMANLDAAQALRLARKLIEAGILRLV
jgi:hypothetical protein